MIAMIMKNKPQFTQMSFALETGLGLVRSNYHYGWDLIVDSKPGWFMAPACHAGITRVQIPLESLMCV